MGNSLLNYYFNLLNINEIPEFLIKYLKCSSLVRLKNVGYFCGMDYASKDIYDFKEYISRFDHSLSVALMTYKLTKDKKSTLAGLFHDAATPCFSHVIDYMNRDYAKQESTEEYTEQVLRNDKYLLKCLEEDNISVEDIINFKKYSIVDNERPKLCADRLDGVILTGIGWTKNIDFKDIENILENIIVYNNEFNESEIGFVDELIAKKVIEVSKSIDIICHSKEDNYMMSYLARITKLAIDRKYIEYDDLYCLNEKELINILENNTDDEIKKLVKIFRTINHNEISTIELPYVKERKLCPLVNGKRLY